jgi:hypothetical protein
MFPFANLLGRARITFFADTKPLQNQGLYNPMHWPFLTWSWLLLEAESFEAELQCKLKFRL